MDSDGIRDEPLWDRARLEVKGSDIHFDFSRSSPPCRGPMNTPFAATQSAVYIGVRHMFPDVPINAGGFEPIHIAEARGTFLHAEYPRPVAGAAAECSQRVVEAVLGALGRAMPDRAYAGPFGTAGNFSLGGYDPKRDRHYVMYYFSGGGYGGYWSGDGHTNACATIAFTQTQPFEVLEPHYPVLFEEASLREDSAGAGEYRGGFGIQLQGEAAARRGLGVVHDGSRPLSALRAGGRHHRLDDRDRRVPGRTASRIHRTSPRAPAMRWPPATGWKCRRPAAAAGAIRGGATRVASRVTWNAAMSPPTLLRDVYGQTQNGNEADGTMPEKLKADSG